MRDVTIYTTAILSADSAVELTGNPARHISQVLRMRAGQSIILFNGHGGEYPATIEDAGQSRVLLRTGVCRNIERESPLHVTLWHGLCRAERMDSVVQKATELGAVRIQPVLTERSVIKLDANRARKKTSHWQKIAVSACEQSGRNRIPEICAPKRFTELLNITGEFDQMILLDPSGNISITDALADDGIKSLLIVTGPEGGFTTGELAAADEAGLCRTHAGPRVLRTETAPLAALSIAQLLAGDLSNRSKRN